MSLMAETTNRIAAGEVLQLAKAGSSDTDKETYFDIIDRKTAILFEAACKGAAILAESDNNVIESLGTYGKHVGIAFQLIDDYLDYAGNSEEMGKNIGDDLAEGKTTLPLILAMQQLDKQDSKTISDAIVNKDVGMIDVVSELVNKTTALQDTHQQALDYAESAKSNLACLPESEYKDMLKRIADLAVKRAA